MDEKVWHLDVGSSPPGAVGGSKGWAVSRPMKNKSGFMSKFFICFSSKRTCTTANMKIVWGWRRFLRDKIFMRHQWMMQLGPSPMLFHGMNCTVKMVWNRVTKGCLLKLGSPLKNLMTKIMRNLKTPRSDEFHLWTLALFSLFWRLDAKGGDEF